ncbi:hypothetical protein OPV22_025363 [Ensete ventricosum]|uniref:Uncharacterized protein n=1 Tax=Ensete ventricosum TaxID=4639 RepID=A0AAV8QHC5_ENSVE|nr:hypothetical protein OPV22_025363 [Ensete ventricosum]
MEGPVPADRKVTEKAIQMEWRQHCSQVFHRAILCLLATVSLFTFGVESAGVISGRDSYQMLFQSWPVGKDASPEASCLDDIALHATYTITSPVKGDDSWACKAVVIGSSGRGICASVASLATSAVDEQTATHVCISLRRNGGCCNDD